MHAFYWSFLVLVRQKENKIGQEKDGKEKEERKEVSIPNGIQVKKKGEDAEKKRERRERRIKKQNDGVE
jgi:hypothetical protein